MLRLRNRFHILLFSVFVTLFAVGMATLLEFLFYPDEFVTTAPGKKFIIVSTISLPIAWIVADVMRKNQMLTEQLREMVNQDGLTTVATRYYFFARMEAVPKAYGVSLMIDIDHFKHVNDTYGHLAGDEAIRHVAKTLIDSVRVEDMVCRFGGEEFVIFLDAHSEEEGHRVAERIRRRIAESPISFEGSEIAITASIGGSAKHSDETVCMAIKRADAALYRAKGEGRNRTIFIYSDAEIEARSA